MVPCPHEGPNKDRNGGAPSGRPLRFPRHVRFPTSSSPLEGVTLRSLQGRQGGQLARSHRGNTSSVGSTAVTFK
jgi:hypothetical protein